MDGVGQFGFSSVLSPCFENGHGLFGLGNATFVAALITEVGVLACFFFTEIPYLWFNVIGAVFLVFLAHILNPLWPGKAKRI